MKKRNIITASVLSAAMLMTACGSTGDSAPADPAADVGTENAGASAETENASDEETGSSPGETVEIVYTARGNADEIKVYQQAVDAFNEAQSSVHVTFEASPSDGYNQSLITQQILFSWKIRSLISSLKTEPLPIWKISWLLTVPMQK